MNQAFGTALVTLYEADEIGDDTNGLWLWEAPTKNGVVQIERPYTVFEWEADTSSAMNTTRRPHWEIINVTFSICSALPSPVEVTHLFDLLTDLLDPLGNLAMANYDTIRIDRTGEELVPDPDEGWVYEVSYKFEMENRLAD